MKNLHIPVMLSEVMDYLQPQSGDNLVDGTLGGGGYTLALAAKVAPGGRVLGIDLDPMALANFEKVIAKIKGLKKNIILAHGNFADLKQICHEVRFNKISGIVLDLGLSSNQLEDPERGFSFQGQGSLDMRFDPAGDHLTAFEIINNYKVSELVKLFGNLGEEKLALPISKKIHEIRQAKKISSTQELAEIVAMIYQRHFKSKSKINPATKVFQALRMAVNHELENLEKFLPQALELLEVGGKLAVVSFHSLEDRIVKNFFRQESRDCLCPPESPICQCGHRARLKILTKKAVIPSAKEIVANPRSRSAKLRVAQKI